MNLPKIVGISAKIGCGKSTLAQLLCEKYPQYKIMSLGDMVKKETAEWFGFPVGLCYSQEGKTKKIYLPWEDKHYTVRELLQWYGTDFVRENVSDTYWVDRLVGQLNGKHVIVDDVRFVNEADRIKDLGGVLIRLAPYDGWEPGPSAGHRSETDLDSYPHFDLTTFPKYGDLSQVAESIFLEDFMPRDEPEPKKIIYVAGPYRADSEIQLRKNIEHARDAAIKLWQDGWVVICPHMNTAHFGGACPVSVWLEGDLEILKRCDAIYMLNTWEKSEGAKEEYRIAKQLGLEILFEPKPPQFLSGIDGSPIGGRD